jgi:hypothetical protein
MMRAIYSIRDIVKRIIPEPHYSNVRRSVLNTARALNYRLVNVSHNRVFEGNPAYDYDYLMTGNVAGFLKDPRFLDAYSHYEATHVNPWFKQYKIYWRLHVMIWAANKMRAVEGDFVECGVYRGASVRAIMQYMDFAKLNKKFYLLDTFAGTDEKYLSEDERQRNANWKSMYEKDYYDDVVNTFKQFPNVKIIRGTVPDTLTQVDTNKVAYLSIDMNGALPEIAAAEFFWDKLVSGAVIVLDDYGRPSFPETKIKFDAFAASKGVEVLSLPTGQGLILKP